MKDVLAPTARQDTMRFESHFSRSLGEFYPACRELNLKKLKYGLSPSPQWLYAIRKSFQEVSEAVLSGEASNKFKSFKICAQPVAEMAGGGVGRLAAKALPKATCGVRLRSRKFQNLPVLEV